MQNAIIVHGSQSKRQYFDPTIPTASNSEWIPWLQKQLLLHDIQAYAPDMMHPYKPDYDYWKREVERFQIGPQTMLVGHSAGGGFWVRYLSEHPELRVGKVVLVAPWLDPNNIRQTIFFDFEFDPNIAERTAGLTIFHSTNDHEGISWSVQMLLQILNNVHYVQFENYGHFCLDDMGTPAFPELLATLIGQN